MNVTHVPPDDSLDHYALAYVMRRVWVEASWGFGAVLAASGIAYAATCLLFGVDPETGVIMTGLGLVLAGVGWVASAAQRFTRRPPKPARSTRRAEESIQLNHWAAAGSIILMLIIIVALAVNIPAGLAPEIVPVLVLLASWACGYAALLMRIRALLISRRERYLRWLQG